MTAAHTIKEPKPYDPTRFTSRLAFAAVIVLAITESATWLTGDRADNLAAVVVQILGVGVLPIVTIVFGNGLIHDARYSDKPAVDDLIGFAVLWVATVGVAIYSAKNFTTFALGILMLSIVALLRTIRDDRRASA